MIQSDIDRFTFLLWIAVIILWMVRAFGNKATLRVLPNQMKIRYAVIIIVILLFCIPVFHGYFHKLHFLPQSIPVSLFGLLLTTLGIGLAIWARFFLGANWSAEPTVKRDHTLIVEGPYRFVRHPIYAGFLAALLGTAFVQTETRTLIIFVFVFVIFSIKARTEEKLMIETFGDQYLQYMQSVKGLIPFLWW